MKMYSGLCGPASPREIQFCESWQLTLRAFGNLPEKTRFQRVVDGFSGDTNHERRETA